MQQYYKFRKSDFNTKGFNQQGDAFNDIVAVWETEFHKEFFPFFANCFVANFSTMELLKSCFLTDEDEEFGMDSDLSLEENIAMEIHGGLNITYGIESGVPENAGEGLLLITDNKISDGMVILKYISDDDDDDDETPIEPVEVGRKVKILVPI